MKKISKQEELVKSYEEKLKGKLSKEEKAVCENMLKVHAAALKKMKEVKGKK